MYKRQEQPRSERPVGGRRPEGAGDGHPSGRSGSGLCGRSPVSYTHLHPVSKTKILEQVWDYGFDPQTNVVDVVMHRLRNKIDPDHTRIETLRGVGYVFRPHA